MNLQRPFICSSFFREQRRAQSRQLTAEKIAALTEVYKAAALDSAIMNAIEGFEPGQLNAEEREWADADPELAKLLAMCSQKELERMREERMQKYT